MEQHLFSFSESPSTPDFGPTMRKIVEAVLRGAFGIADARARLLIKQDTHRCEYFRVAVSYSGAEEGVGWIPGVLMGVMQRVLRRTCGTLGWSAECCQWLPWRHTCPGIAYLRTLLALRDYTSPYFAGTAITLFDSDDRPVMRVMAGVPLGSIETGSVGIVSGQVQGVGLLTRNVKSITLRSSASRCRTIGVRAGLSCDGLVGEAVLARVHPVRGKMHYMADAFIRPQYQLFESHV
jgi:hypothetical protein